MENKKDTRDYRKRTKTSITPAQLLELGKLPPQAVDLEEAVLGACMLDREHLEEVMGILKPESFYKNQHILIFDAIQRLFMRQESVDVLTVTQELKAQKELDNAGGAFYVTSLTNRVASSANLIQHSFIIKQQYIRREFIRVSTTVLQDAYDDSIDVLELVEKAEEAFTLINEQVVTDTTQSMAQVLSNSVKEIENAIEHKGLTGIASGYPELDAILHGWQKKKGYVLAARPGSGKSTLMLNCAFSAVDISKAPVLIFSFEMDNIELGKKVLAAEAAVSYKDINRGRIDADQLKHIRDKSYQFGRMPIYFEDRASLSISQVKLIARKYKRKYGVKLIIIDYLQKVRGSKNYRGNREQEVSEISNEIKIMAKSLNLPVIALSQLGRSVEERKDKVPILADLRESGAIEQDADVVLFIFRPIIHGIKEDAQGNNIENMAKIIVAKHRGGTLGEVKLRFDGDRSKFISNETQTEMPLTPLTSSESPV